MVYRKNLVVNKVDENGNDLPGASFTLTDAEGNVIEPSFTEGLQIVYNDVAEGTYTLSETTAPSGYAKADDVTIELKADLPSTITSGYEPCAWTATVSGGDAEAITLPEDKNENEAAVAVQVADKPEDPEDPAKPDDPVKPEDPTKPEEPAKPEVTVRPAKLAAHPAPSKKVVMPATGDVMPLAAMAELVAGAAVALAGSFALRRKSR